MFTSASFRRGDFFNINIKTGENDMKKIYTNETKRAMVFGDIMLLPGSNVTEAIDEEKYPIIKALVENGDITISEDPTSAVRKANTQKTVDDIMKMAKDNESTQAAGRKRKQQLDLLDEEAAKAKKEKEKAEKEETEEQKD